MDSALTLTRRLRWYDLITINIYFLGIMVIAQTNGLVFPLLVQEDVDIARQASYLGSLRLWTLMAALLAQSFWGLLSDRCTSRWGRRRPFILGSTLAALALTTGIGLRAEVAGVMGFWVLLALSVGQSVSTNAGLAAAQGLIPDLVPTERRGIFSGVKAIFEVPLPLVLVALTIARLISAGMLPAALFLAGAILLVVTAITLLVPEQPLEGKPPPWIWQPLLRLVAMAGVFTAIILAGGAALRQISQAALGSSLPWQIVIVGGAGLLLMLVTVVAGVWLSIRISIGREAARQNQGYTWWVINRLAFLAGLVNLATFILFYLQTRLNLPGAQAAGPAAIGMAVIGVFILVTAPLSGVLSDRIGTRPILAICGLMAALGVGIAMVGDSLTWLYLGAALIGLSAGFFYTASWALGTRLVPKADAARYLGIANLAGAGAGALGAYLGGPVADHFSLHALGSPALGYIVIFGIYGLLFLFSILAISRIKYSEST